MKRYLKAVTAAALAALAANPASTVTLLIRYDPITDTNPAFTFNIDSNPTAIEPDEFGFAAAITNGTGRYFGLGEPIFFYNDLNGGLFDDYYGPPIFTGSTQFPALLQSGTFAARFADDPNLTGTVTIGAIAAVAPEPATWALTLVGFGIVGSGLRGRRKAYSIRLRLRD